MGVSTQFWPWYDVNKLVEYAELATKKYPFSHIWMCDHIQYEETAAIIAAMAPKVDASLGPMVTFPWRNPLELAQRYSTISKTSREGRGVAIGFGAGGIVDHGLWVDEKAPPVALIKESVVIMRELFAGQKVQLSGFPKLAQRLRYNPKHTTKLFFPPKTPIPVYVGAAGPKMSEMAGESADGIIFAQLPVTTGLRGVEAGIVKQYMDLVDSARKRSSDPNRSFKKIYNLHVSVSRDGNKAKQWGKRNAGYGIADTYMRFPHIVEELGVDPKAASHVCDAYLQGLGLEEATRRVTDELLEQSGVMVSGTPSQVIEESIRAKRLLEKIGFDHITFGVPVGPDVPEALDLLGREVIPAVIGD